MIIRTAETDELTEITLHYWNGKEWSENLFDDLACEFADGCESEFDGAGTYGGVIYIASAEELKDLVAYWQNEVELVNGGDYSEKLTPGDCAELPAGCRYLLIVGDAGEYYDYG